MALLAAGAALGMDRFSDNPGQLPTLFFLCCLAPLALRWWEALDDRALRRIALGGVAALVILGIAEATSQHDAQARRVVRETEALVAGGCDSVSSAQWADRLRLRLACLQGSNPPER